MSVSSRASLTLFGGLYEKCLQHPLLDISRDSILRPVEEKLIQK